ncbi:MAG: HD domain-containing protein [Candidatus Bathyarchaeia archaeon]
MSEKGFWGFIKDPIYGYIRLTETEKRILDTGPVQRLRRIRQLSGAEYVYPAATHTRFEHVLGTMYLAGVVAENLPAKLDEGEKKAVKVAALLHDVGHAPFSHLFEPILQKYVGKTHEDMSTSIILNSELSNVLQHEGLDPNLVSRLCVGRFEDPKRAYLDQIIRSSVDVDKMDFVLRDSYHTGAGYGGIDIFRLIYTMDVLNGNLAVDVTALSTLESFILARLESFRTIYFHKTSRAAQIMLLKALEYAKDDLDITQLGSVDEYLALDDDVVWAALRGNAKSRTIVDDLNRRRLLKCAYEKTFFVKDEFLSSLFTKDTVRVKMEEEIAHKAKVAVEDVSIDLPSLPSVPYHSATELEPMDIPVFYRGPNGEKLPQKISEVSKIVDVLMAYMNIIRVYTDEQYRDEVQRAAASVLGESALSSLVSY